MNSRVEATKLGIGTVQFGMPYGISNQSGQVQPEDVKQILDIAKAHSITTLDTAIAYGQSESVLGAQDLSGMEVITKLPEVPDRCKSLREWILGQVDGSLARLKLPTLNGLLLHRPGQLMDAGGDNLYQQLQVLKQEGIVGRIGVSVYGPEELDALCSRFNFDLVQAPFNILDRRLTNSGWLKRLSDAGTGLHVRSVFMQGLLLMPRTDRPSKFSPWDGLWRQWESWLEETRQTPLEACLRHALSIPEIERVIVGVETPIQLQEILNAVDGPSFEVPEQLFSDDPKLLNPGYWNKL